MSQSARLSMFPFYKNLSSVLFFLIMLTCQVGFGQQGTAELESAMILAAKDNDYKGASAYAFEIANRYWGAKQQEKALDFLDKCISYSRKGNEQNILFLAYQQQGLIYRSGKNFSKASDAYEKSVKAARMLPNSNYLKESLINAAECYSLLKKPKKALPFLEEALSLSIRENDEKTQKTSYLYLVQSYKALGNSLKAKEHQSLYNKLIEIELSEVEKMQQVAQLEQEIYNADAEKNTVNEQLIRNNQRLKQTEDSLINTSLYLTQVKEINEKRKLEIDILNKDKELAALQIKEQQAALVHEAWIRNSVIGGLFLASALVVVVVFSYRRTVKANKQIEKQNNNIK